MKKMNNRKTILFCGGDSRMTAAARFFAADGFLCKTYCCSDSSVGTLQKLDSIDSDTDYVILPIPSFIGNERLNCNTYITMEQLFSRLNKNTVVFGGIISDFILKCAAEYNLKVSDYAAREEFSQLNAVPTAEAAIVCAADKLKKTVWGSEFTVVGYGRIGKALARRLCALGGVVTVAARNKGSLATAYYEGCKTVTAEKFLSSPCDADVCFNTVPCRIIGEKTVSSGLCEVYIDLASIPGGFCTEAEAVLGNKLTRALSLPGKYSPVTAGEIIYKTVKTMIDEMGG